MSKRNINNAENYAHFITFSCYHRRRLLDLPELRETLIDLLTEKIVTHDGICSGYVVMPDHVHALVWFPESGVLSRFMKSWKQTSSLKLKKMLRGLAPNYFATFDPTDPFWQAGYYPFEVYSRKKAQEKITYMHMNPVRSHLVERCVDWPSSSATYYLLNEPSKVPLQWIF